jgi:hypothetical protein
VSLLPQWDEERLKGSKKKKNNNNNNKCWLGRGCYLVVYDVSNGESNSNISACFRTTLTVISDVDYLLVD